MYSLVYLERVVGRKQRDSIVDVWIVEYFGRDLIQRSRCSSWLCNYIWSDKSAKP